MGYLAHCLRIKSLCLGSTGITDEGLKCISQLPRLEDLDVCNTAVSDAGLASLSACQSLSHVEVRATRVTADGVARFKKARPGVTIAWSTVTSADVRHAAADLTRMGLNVICGDEIGPEVQRLKYWITLQPGWNSNTSPERVHELVQIVSKAEKVMLSLRDVRDCDITVFRGLEHLWTLSLRFPQGASLTGLKQISTIGRLDKVILSGEGCNDEALAMLRIAPTLQCVRLTEAPHVTASGIDKLTQLPRLATLELDSGFKDEFVGQLGNLQGLRELSVGWNVSDDAIKKLRASHPNVKVHHEGG
jgi:hypothetical protein